MGKLPTKYRIVLVKDGELFKHFCYYKQEYHARKKYNKIISKNQVLYEKRYTIYEDLRKSKKELLLLKKKDLDYKPRYYMNSLGKINEIIEEGDWEIMESFHWREEETFHVYGLKERLDLPDILKKAFLSRNKIYEVVMVHNKIVIDDKSDMEVILCKNIPETRRLYDFIFRFLVTQGINNFLFLGTANKGARKLLYDRMQEIMGTTRRELYRKSTN